MVTSFGHCNDASDRRAISVRPACVGLFIIRIPRAGTLRVCKIDRIILHWKKNGNPDLV